MGKWVTDDKTGGSPRSVALLLRLRFSGNSGVAFALHHQCRRRLLTLVKS